MFVCVCVYSLSGVLKDRLFDDENIVCGYQTHNILRKTSQIRNNKHSREKKRKILAHFPAVL